MATVYQKKENGQIKSPYWFARFKLANGKLKYKSTGLTKRREAQRLANEWEVDQFKLREEQIEQNGELLSYLQQAYSEMNKGRFNLDRYNHYLSMGFETAEGKEASMITLKDYLAQWLNTRKDYVAGVSIKNYRIHVKSLLGIMGSIADKLLANLTTSDLHQIKSDLISEAKLRGTTNITINIKMKTIKMAITEAYNNGIILRNVGLPIKDLPQDDSFIKGAFSKSEIEKLLKVAPEGWKGAILFASQTGLRARNIGNLKWGDVDIGRKILTVIPVKQRRIKEKQVRHFRLTDEMLGYLEFIGIQKTGVLFPNVGNRHCGARSDKFRNIMRDAGVPREIEKEGRVEIRSFHSLRHSFNTFLAQAKVSQDMRMKITGHATAAINEIYTHQEEKELHEVVLQSLPKFEWQDVI